MLALLGTVELAVRLTLPPVSSLDALVTAPEQQFSFRDRQHVGIFEGDPLLFWRLQPNLRDVVWDLTVVSTNAQHLRHPGLVAAKPRGRFRIVCVGDSVTFGYRVPLVFPENPGAWDRAEQPYPRLLEAALRAAHPAADVEVVALAVPGYSSHQGLAWLRRDIGWLQPDVVTWCFGWNDVGPRQRSDVESMRADALHVAVRRAVLHSQALLRAARWLRERRSGPATPAGPVERVAVDASVENALEMARLAAAHGARALVIAPVYRDAVTFPEEAGRMAAHRDALGKAARGAGIPLLEIPALEETSWPANDALFGETIHPNGAGHRLIARELQRALESGGMLAALR